MNIAEAKTQVKNAMRAYFAKDEFGNYLIPPRAQRPVFLMGPPGIGKTAIMAQIASELGVGLISYSMTHHTRQSALGLPLISKKTYGGEECSVTEYTMSEIIASVYDMIAEGGADEGILFLDEINCVSETLTPTMLQFLQYKTFGRHAVPEGWIVVTAGNPPEYNRSAREFDVVTWDRLKRIDIEPSYPAWKTYASQKGVHASVLSYLDAKKENFYKVEAGAGSPEFVTARGWDDLSDMIAVCEKLGISVDLELISQYLQDKTIAEDFAIYYDLWQRYRSDYRIDAILSGNAPEEIIKRAKGADFDERLTLLGLLLDNVRTDIRAAVSRRDELKELLGILREVKAGACLADKTQERTERLERDIRRGILSTGARRSAEYVLSFLREHSGSDFAAVKADFDALTCGLRASEAAAGAKLDRLFDFAAGVWGEGEELLVLITELSADAVTAGFISHCGCEGYYRYCDVLMFSERKAEILKELSRLEEEL